MERLTRRSSNGTGVYNTPSGDPVEWENNRHRVLQKLADYEDLEEKGLLLKLPCKVGDVLYSFVNGELMELEVLSIKYQCEAENHGVFIREKIVVDAEGIPTEIDFCDIGKTIFLTKKQAEKALNRLQSEVEE